MSEVKVRTTIGGSIWQIVAAAGDDVAKDDTILVMESMKMEIPITAPRAGRVKAFLVQAGQVVAEDDVVSASRHVGTNRAANSSRSDDGELHSVPFVEPLTSARGGFFQGSRDVDVSRLDNIRPRQEFMKLFRRQYGAAILRGRRRCDLKVRGSQSS